MNNEQSPIEETWKNVKDFFGIVAVGLWWGLISVAALGMLLQLILEIDITEFDKSYRLLLLAFAGGIIGTYLYSKNKEEKGIQEQLDKMRRKETFVGYLHPKAAERYKKEEEFKKYVEKRRELEVDPRGDPFSPVPDDPANPRRQLLTEMQKEMTKERKEPSSSPQRLLVPLSLSAEQALAAVKAHLGIGGKQSLSMMEKIKIPKGLHKCEKCGEYKGKVRERDFSHPDQKIGFETTNGTGYLGVSCLCDGILCSICKKNKIHRPISNSYDEKDNDILHHPYFTGMMGCAECREKQNNQQPQNNDKS